MFGDLQSHIRESLQKRHVRTSSVAAHISGIIAPKSDSIDRLLKHKNSIDTLFMIINSCKCWNFLDFNLLENIVDKYGDNEDKRKLTGYQNQLGMFWLRRKVSDLKGKCLPLHADSEIQECHSENVTFKIDVKMCLEKLPFNDITTLKTNVCKIVKLPPASIQLLDINNGCLEVIFLVPEGIYESVFLQPLTEAQCTALMDASVVSISSKDFHRIIKVRFLYSIHSYIPSSNLLFCGY